MTKNRLRDSTTEHEDVLMDKTCTRSGSSHEQSTSTEQYRGCHVVETVSSEKQVAVRAWENENEDEETPRYGQTIPGCP